MTEQVLDNEGLTTLMCEVEAMVNGRPITKVSNDPCDLEPLKPNHLLLLRAGPSVPPGTFSKQDKTVFRAINRLKDSLRAKDVYITQDYAKVIQQERKVLIKAMFQVKERGLSPKVIDRKLNINNVIYKVSNIPKTLGLLNSVHMHNRDI